MTAALARAAPPRKVLVAGLGNTDRGDDGVGALVVRHLLGRLPADVTIMMLSGDVLSVIDRWRDFDALVCVDASEPGSTPGSIHRLDLARTELPCEASITSSHGFGLAETIGLGRALQQVPPEILVYAVEGARFDGGAAITREVAAAALRAADAIVAEVMRLRAGAAAACA